MIWIDYHQGTHGSFLGYVTNVWIGETPPIPAHDIFSEDTGAAHRFHKDREWHALCKIMPAHLSWPNLKAQVRDQEPIVQISVAPADRRLLYVPIVNMWHRAGDRGFQERFGAMYQEREHDPQKIRPFFEHAINEQLEISPFDDFPNNPIAHFDFRSFFSWSDFCRSLKAMANFVGLSFLPTPDLYDLWCKFISVNLGLQSYNRCESILQDMFAGRDTPFQCDIFEQAWINLNVRDMFGHIPDLLQQSVYPTNTRDLRGICLHV